MLRVKPAHLRILSPAALPPLLTPNLKQLGVTRSRLQAMTMSVRLRPADVVLLSAQYGVTARRGKDLRVLVLFIALYLSENLRALLFAICNLFAIYLRSICNFASGTCTF